MKREDLTHTRLSRGCGVAVCLSLRPSCCTERAGSETRGWSEQNWVTGAASALIAVCRSLPLVNTVVCLVPWASWLLISVQNNKTNTVIVLIFHWFFALNLIRRQIIVERTSTDSVKRLRWSSSAACLPPYVSIHPNYDPESSTMNSDLESGF